jgi:superfamily II DNA or RNA helicase
LADAPVPIRVDNRIRIWRPRLSEEEIAAIKSLFSHANPKAAKLRAMGYRYDHRKEPRAYETWDEGPEWLSVSRGGMGRVRTALRDRALSVKDERTDGEFDWSTVDGWRWPEKLRNKDGSERTLWEDQERVVAACSAKQNCLIRSGTASGKTSSLIALAVRLRVPALFVVWEGGLFRQWVERLQDELGLARAWIGRYGSGTKVLSPLTVGMQQTISRVADPKFFRLWGYVAADEVQRFGADSFVKSIDPFPARYRIGASADERRADGKDFLIYDQFGAVAIEVAHAELVEKGRVLPVPFRVIPTGWRPDVPEGEEEFWRASGAEPPVDSSDWGSVCDAMEDSRARTLLAVEAAAGYAREGHKVLVFSLRVGHCREIDQRLAGMGVRTGLLIGGAEYRPAYEETKEGLRSGRIQVGVGTVQAVGQGLDFPEVDRGVVAMPIAENRSMLGQVKGRICRMREGKDAEVSYLWDQAVWPGHLAKLAKVADGCLVKLGSGWVDPKEWRAAKRGMMRG